TLTTGKPVVTEVYFGEEIKEAQQREFEAMIVSMESKSNHPLAQANIKHYENIVPIELEVENIVGIGLVTDVGKTTDKIGKHNSNPVIPKDIKKQTDIYEREGKTVVYFGTDDKVLALLVIQDVPKETSKEAIPYFKAENIHTVMLTGDAKQT